jgi:hypothetical protein
MPWFTYFCKLCGRQWQQSLPTREPYVKCLSTCPGTAVNVRKAGTSIVYERLDNGAMARAVERPHNIEEMIEERSDQSVPQPDDVLGKDNSDPEE